MVVNHRMRILVFNPNTSTSITDTFKPILSKLNLPNTDVEYWTCPSGPSIIRSPADMYESTLHCMPLLLDLVEDFDGFLGACYADHPVVRLLRSYTGIKPVVGIFDASIQAALQLVTPRSKFGIITTGEAYEVLLSDGVKHLLDGTKHGLQQLQRFGGVSASGIGLQDLEKTARSVARVKIVAATRKIVRSGEVDVLCVGGVILAGMEGWIREACEAELGAEFGRKVRIIDQLVAGITLLNATLLKKSFVDFRIALR